MRPGLSTVGRECDSPDPYVFASTARPCGQPAAVGGIGCFRPLPPQIGHFKRINAMPSVLPFKSNGFATYPVPPQFWQSSGLTPFSPSLLALFSLNLGKSLRGTVFRYESRTKPEANHRSNAAAKEAFRRKW